MAMAASDVTPGSRVVDLCYSEPRKVWIVDRVVDSQDGPTAECHGDADPERRARIWVRTTATAPAAAPEAEARGYRWEDLRDTTAGDLQPGDVVFSLDAFQVVHVYKGGRVTGGGMLGMLTPRGTARTVVARDGNRITFRNHPDGHEWAAEIKPDHPVLRVESADPKEQ